MLNNTLKQTINLLFTIKLPSPIIITHLFFGLNNAHTTYLGDYRKQPIKYNQVLDSLPKNQRIWFIFSNVLKTRNDVSDRSYIFDYLSQIGGNIIEQYGGDDTFSSAYLVILR